MGEKGAAASKQTSAPRVPSPRGLRILVAGAAASWQAPSSADRGQGGQGGGQLGPGPSGCQARTAPNAGPRASSAAQHQQEADRLPQVQMVAPGQRPVPARVPSQLCAWRQRHGREVHRVVALGLHWTGREGGRRDPSPSRREPRDRRELGRRVPTLEDRCSSRQRETPAGPGNQGNEPGTQTRRHRNWGAVLNDWR